MFPDTSYLSVVCNHRQERSVGACRGNGCERRYLDLDTVLGNWRANHGLAAVGLECDTGHARGAATQRA